MFFDWLRSRVKTAILEGANDAFRELDQATQDAPVPVTLAFLPAPEESENSKPQRKAVRS